MARFGSNWFAFGLQFVAISLCTAAIFIPAWLYVRQHTYNTLSWLTQNDPIDQNYPYPRRWGLLRVVGRLSRSHTRTMEVACEAAAKTAIGGNCAIGICPWFMAKCAAWRLLSYTSYIVSSTAYDLAHNAQGRWMPGVDFAVLPSWNACAVPEQHAIACFCNRELPARP